MGGRLSKGTRPREGRSNTSTSTSSSNGNANGSSQNSNSPLVPDLTAYVAALADDPSLRSFDNLLRDRTTSVIESVSPAAGDNNSSSSSSSFSLHSLHQVTGSLVDINEHVLEHILQSKEDIWNNPELRDLVEDYFKNTKEILSFYSALDKCLKKIRNNHIYIQLALKRFDEEKIKNNDNNNNSNCFPQTLQELDNFKAAGDPFDREFFVIFQSVYDNQVSMMLKLQAKRKKLDKKMKSLRSYRKVSNVLFAAVFASVVICSVVAAAIAAPAVVAALVAAAAAPLGSVGKWISSLWKSYEDEVRREMELVFEMEIETFAAVKELESIRGLVDRLKIEIESMIFKADFAVRLDDEVAVNLAVDEIKKNLGVFMQSVDVLSEHSDRFSRDIRRARAVISQRIIKFPSSG